MAAMLHRARPGHGCANSRAAGISRRAASAATTWVAAPEHASRPTTGSRTSRPWMTKLVPADWAAGITFTIGNPPGRPRRYHAGTEDETHRLGLGSGWLESPPSPSLSPSP